MNIPPEALDDRLAFFGTSGSGKTYGAGVMVERLLGHPSRVIIVDPLGVWWGLRVLADGTTPSKRPVVIFGGKHGDLPLTEVSGALIGETVAGMSESVILDLSAIGTKAGERRFMFAFLTALYRKTPGNLQHIIFDEADMWAPQRLLDKEGDAAKLLGMMETIVRRGRVKGFLPWLISQRPAVISKDVLSQIDGMFAFKLTAVHDRDAIGGWVEAQADPGQWNAIYGKLAAYQTGHALVWIPGRGIFAERQMPQKKTFDSSRAPKRGEKVVGASLTPIDVDKVKAKLARVVDEAKANDPEALKRRIAELERAAKAPSAPVQDAKALMREYERGYGEGISWAFDAYGGRIKDAMHRLTHLSGECMALKDALEIPVRRPPIKPAERAPRSLPQAASSPRPSTGAVNGANLPKGERACLICIAQQPDGATREMLTVVTGYKRSSRDAYVQRLREKGYVEMSGDRVVSTIAGRDALGSDYEPLPTGAALIEFHYRRLPEGERRVLETLVNVYPDPLSREAIDEITGYKRSSRDAYIQRLSARQLVTTGSNGVTASDNLFS